MSGVFRPVALKLDSIEIPIYEALDYNESIQGKGGLALLRTVKGLGIRQSAWKKRVIQISGGGSLPSALGEIDTDVSHVLSLAMPRSIQQLAPLVTFTVPAAHRTDLTLTQGGVSAEGYAVMSRDEFIVQTPVVSFVGNTVVITAVTGAIAYRVNYWPKFTVYIDPPSDEMDIRAAEHGWSLTAEEI